MKIRFFTWKNSIKKSKVLNKKLIIISAIVIVAMPPVYVPNSKLENMVFKEGLIAA
jgi:hypothetical protein